MDNNTKLRLIRSLSSLPQSVRESLPVSNVVKKKVNIPICDTHVDGDYDSIVSPTFQLPQNYIRHVRRIGDEVDVTMDYNIDADDKVSTINFPNSAPSANR